MSMYKLKFTSTINIGSNKSPVWIATIDVLAVSKLNRLFIMHYIILNYLLLFKNGSIYTYKYCK